MSDDDLADNLNDDVTEPARQGEVPDWFATSEESQPVVVPEPEPDVPVAAAPADVPASAVPVPDEPPPEVPPAVYETAAEADAEPPVSTRRRARPAEPPVGAGGTRRRRQPIPPPPPPPPTARGYGCADVITSIFLLLTVLVASVTILLIANPQSPLNPFPAKTFPALVVIPTDLPTDLATGTYTAEPATPTLLPSMTYTALPTTTATVTATPTQTPVIGAGGTDSGTGQTGTAPTPAATAGSGASGPASTLSLFAFTVKPLQYTANKTSEGCNWQSIAGSVVDMAGKPIQGIAIHVTGSNGNIDEMHYSGTETRFGDGGYEVFLGTIPREDTYTIQLLGRTGNPISDLVNVATHSGCQGNVVIVNFVQNHPY